MKTLANWIGTVTKTKFAHGLIMAVVGAIATGLTTCLSSTPPHLPGKADIMAILSGAVIVGIGYIAKNITGGTGIPKA